MHAAVPLLRWVVPQDPAAAGIAQTAIPEVKCHAASDPPHTPVDPVVGGDDMQPVVTHMRIMGPPSSTHLEYCTVHLLHACMSCILECWPKW